MKLNPARASIVVGSLISGVLVLVSLVELLVSSPRWDDHLLNAIGVFFGALFIGFTLRLVTTVLRRRPDVSKRSRLASVVWLFLLMLFVLLIVRIAMFIDTMSFL
jgi:hypothetical protein